MADETPSSSFTTQVRKGLLSYCILRLCSDEPVYTSDLLATLKEFEMIVTEGTLYPLLNRLKREGLLNYKWHESASGPPRKYYEISAAGTKHLDSLSKEWQALTNSVHQLETRNSKSKAKGK